MNLTFIVPILLLMLGSHTAIASVQSEIDKATKAGKCVFVVVTEPGNPDEAKALAIAKRAQSLHSKSVVVAFNRSDKANAALVKKYSLESVPLPAILVIASNGILAGGLLASEATAEALDAMIPSPVKAKVLKAIQDGNAVFLVVSKKGQKKSGIIGSCQKACDDMNAKAVTVQVDCDDPAEKQFFKELRINSSAKEPMTYVINSSGQLTGSHTGLAEAKTLVASATKKAASGCCPPNSGKTCN